MDLQEPVLLSIYYLLQSRCLSTSKERIILPPKKLPHALSGAISLYSQHRGAQRLLAALLSLTRAPSPKPPASLRADKFILRREDPNQNLTREWTSLRSGDAQ